MSLRGLSRLIGSLCFKSGLSTTIRVSLIVAPDNLAFCQLLVCGIQHPGALAPWWIGSGFWTYLPLEP